MTADDRLYMTTMFEQMLDKFEAISEMFHSMQEQIKTLATKAELQEVADDVKAIRYALTETNKDVADHERRITRLEQAT